MLKLSDRDLSSSLPDTDYGAGVLRLHRLIADGRHDKPFEEVVRGRQLLNSKLTPQRASTSDSIHALSTVQS
jgi:hypothetical protein